MANTLDFSEFENFSDQFVHREPLNPDHYPPTLSYGFWGPPTPSQESTSHQSQRTVLPYHGVSPDHFYQDSPVPQPRRQTPPGPPPQTPSPQTPSPQPTVVPWAPSPPENSPGSILIADRLFQDFDFGPPLIPLQPQQPAPTYNAPRRNPRNPVPQVVRFDERQLAMDAEETAGRAGNLREELAFSNGQVTPGFDETPFIQYALDAITREDGANQRIPSGESEFDGQKPSRTMAHQTNLRDFNNGRAPSPTDHVHSIPPGVVPNGPGADDEGGIPTMSSSASSEVMYQQMKPTFPGESKRLEVRNSRIQLDERLSKRCPPQNFKPWMLRLPSFLFIMTLCCLMIAALVFCAIDSKKHPEGFVQYAGTINSGQYFLFRLLPQILGAILFLYGQAMVLTTFRVLPFMLMASEDPKLRDGAIFQNLYPKSFLWPHMVGPPQIKLVIFLLWLMNFTIPLHSTLFTVIYLPDEKKWAWATVQGSAYALVALYIIFLAAVIILCGFWFGTVTGMLWDFRSVADMVPMLHHSNITHSYRGTQTIPTRQKLRRKLKGRLDDRIGYWQNENPLTVPQDAYSGRFWWGMGSASNTEGREKIREGKPKHKEPTEKKEKYRNDDMEIPAEVSLHQFRYLPWCMRDTQIIYFVVAGFVTLIALFVVSFNPATRLSKGFKPELNAHPDENAFSSANFLYSFIPSLLGQVVFLLFQALELSYRQLAPWAEMLKPEGGLATRTILVDYAACFPFQATYKAIRNKHFRVAFIDFLASVFIFIPILAGGLFMALNVERKAQGLPDEVRMFPSVPVFSVLLLLLCLFVAGLVAMIPNRRKYRLPHAVTCLAEIISFIANDDILSDPAFRFPRTRSDMLSRLAVGVEEGREMTRWAFGTAPGRDETLGVRRTRRFTEKPGVSMRWENRSGSTRGSGRRRVFPQQTPVI